MTERTQQLETVIGLEVHLQFSTRTKIFCGCANAFGGDPNTRTCPVCLGLPGSLPVFNEQALEFAIKAGLALNGTINPVIKFDRKNYFYPDLPKGYQISQFDQPIARNGAVIIPTDNGPKTIRIHRAHLEEDAGKLIHDPKIKSSLVDYNRTGTPLLEIVTEPDLSSPQEAYDYLTALKLILSYLDISDCDMEKGSLRCDANVSIRPAGESRLGTKTELKNMNSFRAVRLGLEAEIERQKALFVAGETIVQETRLWDEARGVTVVMRSKEEAHDYRYFPEPDLVPFVIDPELIERVRAAVPELPLERRLRLARDYQLSDYDAGVLIQDRRLADLFEAGCRVYAQPKKICNWISGPLMAEINTRKKTVAELGLSPEALAELIKAVEEGVVSQLAAKEVLPRMIDTGLSAREIIEREGLAQVSDDTALETVIDAVITENPKVVEQIRSGKEQAMGFLVGQAMRRTQGKANPKRLGEIIKRRIAHA